MTLAERLDYLFTTWAPSVLAADGDPMREDLAFHRPGVREAKREYDRTLATALARSRVDQAAALDLTLELRATCVCER